MSEIVPVVSEALEAQIRNLLPSQRGFGEDLQASNVITPIIDLTAAAEGTNVPLYQQQALAFGNQTAFNVSATSTVLANSPGFYRVIGTATGRPSSGSVNDAKFDLSDGLSTKTVWMLSIEDATSTVIVSESYDLVFFLAAGESLTAVSTINRVISAGSIRQIADVNGVSVNPVGFTPQ